jgi:hypothetical protein
LIGQEVPHLLDRAFGTVFVNFDIDS